MKKHWKMAGALIAAVGLILAGAMTVAARGPQRGSAEWPGQGLRPPITAPMRGGAASGWASEAMAEALGLTSDELRAQLRDGATLADLAEEKGVALADLRALAVGERQTTILERMDQALADGKISDTFANWFKRGADAGYVGAPQRDLAANPTIIAAAEALNMTPAEVELQMWAGRTLADLAERAGVQLTDVQTAIESARKAAAIERIQQQVTAGQLTQERADWMIEGVNEGFGAQRGLGGPAFERGMMLLLGGRPAIGRR